MKQLTELLQRYPQLDICTGQIQKTYHILEQVFVQNKKLMVCGNGGSASDAAHIVGELMKSFVRKRPLGDAVKRIRETTDENTAKYLVDNLQGSLCAISLTGETALISAFANDVKADLIYAQQVLGLGKPGDVLLAISTSGNSANVIFALHVARALGIRTIGLTGQSGGKLKELCDACICVPETDTYKVQELHLPVYHCLCLMLEKRFFG